MAKKNWMNEILGGQILLHSGILQHARFVLLVFVLVIIYIALNFSVEQSLRIERRNNAELKHLKSDYISKSARLQYSSKRDEVEKKLKNLGSELKPPVDPPLRIIMEERR
ncbi:MAG: hypothetical protein EOM61_01415 [Bacteroidia bacterium]|jgi:hypothetical protein|uniref:Cell division protein FtsL n=1 Tax=bioreactor metagenome TaxID=1076179 RepID=A0A644YX87_9ZZZZ|nr:FtsL-like putative cell division protein [Rikenellaceae bacterium]NCB18262.1 hypothetical protein [Bacteroidia bacterium]